MSKARCFHIDYFWIKKNEWKDAREYKRCARVRDIAARHLDPLNELRKEKTRCHQLQYRKTRCSHPGEREREEEKCSDIFAVSYSTAGGAAPLSYQQQHIWLPVNWNSLVNVIQTSGLLRMPRSICIDGQFIWSRVKVWFLSLHIAGLRNVKGEL